MEGSLMWKTYVFCTHSILGERMRDETIIKITAILCLTVIEIVNLFTTKWDGHLLFAIGSIIGGIAGYELAKWKRERK